MSHYTIVDVKAREILDSRGYPTLETDVVLDSGWIARASVPSGASTGHFEAREWRDGEADYYKGKGVRGAVSHVQGEIRDMLLGLDPCAQTSIDRLLIELDHSPMKARLGANALLSVSLAVARAGAYASDLSLCRYLGGASPFSLPVPLMNILNGGVHADNGLDFQEFMIVPLYGNSFSEALHCGVLVFYALKEALKERQLSCMVGDEGGFAPHVSSLEEALSLIVFAIRTAGFEPGRDVWIALDCASSQFYQDGFYRVSGQVLNPKEFARYLLLLCDNFPILSIEDGMAEKDWDGWCFLTDLLGQRVQLVGDDLFVTQVDFLKRGIDSHAANAILLKLNQVGTLTETYDAFSMARGAGYGTIVSHRSGETADSFISDLSVSWSTGQIKIGAPCRTDRTEKYNQLIRIEEELGDGCFFSGARSFSRFL